MSNLFKHNQTIQKKDREFLLNQKSITIWLTGLSASGKSTIANELANELHQKGHLTYVLDGDNVRLGLNKDLGFSESDRTENIRRISEVAKLMNESGVIVITAFISPFRLDREQAKQIIGEDSFVEVFVDASIETCQQRDPKGLYKKALSGEIKNFTGISSPYEPPLNPQLTLKTDQLSLRDCVDSLSVHIQSKLNPFWKKVNHGGQPTNNPDKKYAIFVGRYQPYHWGHINLIRQKLDSGVPALILVRDIEPDDKNPLSTEQTIHLIKKYHQSNGDDVIVQVIPDIESVNYGRGVGYQINEFTPPNDIGFISATKIRESVKNNDDSWKKMVPESIQEDIKNYLTNE